MLDEKKLVELADLAKFSIEEEKLYEFKKHLNEMIASIEEIKKLNLDEIEINYHVNGDKNALAEDDPEESLSREEVLKNTVEAQYGYFKILKVVD